LRKVGTFLSYQWTFSFLVASEYKVNFRLVFRSVRARGSASVPTLSAFSVGGSTNWIFSPYLMVVGLNPGFEVEL